MPIIRENYDIIFGYAVLAQTTLHFGRDATVNNGTYGCLSGDIRGTYTGTSNQIDISGANVQLATLINDINNLASIGTKVPFTGEPGQTFLPNIFYYSVGNIKGTNISFTFDALDNSSNQFYIIADGTKGIDFNNVTFILSRGAQSSNIFWLSNVGNISFKSENNNPIYGTFIAHAIFDSRNSHIINGNVYSQTGGVTFTNAVTINADGACYLKGTKILTDSGYVLIENLSVGDKVVTKGKIRESKYFDLDNDNTLKQIKWIGNFTAPNLDNKSLPICIKAHALGENMPFEDLYVSPGHGIILDDKMVLASELINGETIFQDMSMISIEYYHLELETHYSVIANGVLSESYLIFDGHGVFNKPEIIHENPIVLENTIKV